MINSWDEAEEACARYLRLVGYPGARVTGGGADGGIDIAGSGVIAQVKFHQAKSPRSDLQRLVGAAAVVAYSRLVFFANGGFGQPAIEYARSIGMELVRFDAAGRFYCVTGGLPNASLAQTPTRRAGIREAPATISMQQAGLRPTSSATARPQTGGRILLGILVVVAVAYWSLTGVLTDSDDEPIRDPSPTAQSVASMQATPSTAQTPASAYPAQVTINVTPDGYKWVRTLGRFSMAIPTDFQGSDAPMDVKRR